MLFILFFCPSSLKFLSYTSTSLLSLVATPLLAGAWMCAPDNSWTITTAQPLLQLWRVLAMTLPTRNANNEVKNYLHHFTVAIVVFSTTLRHRTKNTGDLSSPTGVQCEQLSERTNGRKQFCSGSLKLSTFVLNGNLLQLKLFWQPLSTACHY